MKTKERDITMICMEALMSVIGAMGALGFGAFVTGSHIVDWNGIGTAIAFVLLALIIWGIMELSGRKKQMYA